MQVEFIDQLPSQPLENPRNVGQTSSDPHTDHKRRKDPLEEKDDRPSPTIIPQEDFEDEEARDKEIRAQPIPKVSKPPVPYPQLLSRPRVSMSDSHDTLLEAFRQVTITIPLVDAIQHIPSYAKFLIGLCTPTRKPKRIHMSETISSIMLSMLLISSRSSCVQA